MALTGGRSVAAVSPARIVVAFLAFAWLVGIAVAGIDDHHGTDSQVAALPIQGIHQVGFSGVLQLEVECATDIRVDIGQDHGGSDLAEVTVWGRPKVGRCHPTSAAVDGFAIERFGLAHPSDPPRTKFVDGATSQVVEL